MSKDRIYPAVPEGWIEKKLGDIAEICMCKRIMNAQTKTIGDIPFYKIGTFGNQADAYIPRGLYEEYKGNYSYPQKGDILISAAGTIGRTVIFDGKPAYFQDSNIVWLVIDKSEITNEFLYHYYQIIEWDSTEGSTISRLYNDIIRNSIILLPPLPEQHAIAEALSDMDEYIASLQKLIAKKKAIKQGAMQELLTGKRRLPGFDGEWIEKPLSSISDIFKGQGLSKSKLSVNGKYSCILYGELFTTYSEKIIKTKSRTDCFEGIFSKTGDILLPGSTTTVGIDLAKASTLLKDAVLLGGDINIVRLRDININPEFIAYLLTNTKQNDIAILAKGITVYHLHGSDLLNLFIKYPLLKSEQAAITAVLSDMDTEIEALTNRLNKAKSVKQGMMQELLTGRIRLVKPKTPAISATKIIEQTYQSYSEEDEETIILVALVNIFGTEQHPFTAFDRQKFPYLFHRHVDGVANGYKKFPAGPYNPDLKYRTAMPDALKKRYIRECEGLYKGVVIAENAGEALNNFKKRYGDGHLKWMEQFRYIKNRKEELELLTTVDKAIVELRCVGTHVSVSSVKEIIRNSNEWKAKLKRAIFSDENIARAIKWSIELFGEETPNG